MRPSEVAAHSPPMTLSPRQPSSQTSDSCRPAMTPKSNQKSSAFQESKLHSKGKKGTSSKRDIKCFNCHKKGHYTCDCCGPGGAKEGQQPPKGWLPKGNDNTANTAATMQDGAWSAIAPRPIEVLTSVPALLPISDEADIY